MREPSPPARSGVLTELGVVAVLAAGFLVFFRDRPGFVDAALGVVAVALIGLAQRRSRRFWSGQTADASPYRKRISNASREAAAFTLPVAALFLAIGFGAGFADGGWAAALDRVGGWHFAAAFALYLPWALLQQFVFQFYLLGRLLYLLPAPAAIAITALGFSLVHFPRVPVMAVTAVAGAVWALLYRRHRSLPPLAVSHALLGAGLHYWIFGRDLLASWIG